MKQLPTGFLAPLPALDSVWSWDRKPDADSDRDWRLATDDRRLEVGNPHDPWPADCAGVHIHFNTVYPHPHPLASLLNAEEGGVHLYAAPPHPSPVVRPHPAHVLGGILWALVRFRFRIGVLGLALSARFVAPTAACRFD